ncbi:PLD nuclease N-terminal domain-containing protein [Ktedonobacter robiniae]|uniref:Cardiolipin synthase N-terminal domain-containing protein n=1 Tax=Ktedonobacter robiniae TaxID=2778365 RepID=A0ABQ3V376_9CHLR|nr:PLD nuclease N-terminal domain-containing protein [Ktedonobacter robiniae]GHO59407.1 hypothetical protein KSB_78820 [Ktedonobacter robiniae]
MQSDNIMGFIIVSVGIICWIWVLLDCIRDPDLDAASRKRWIAFVALVPAIGALFYVQHRRSEHKAQNFPATEAARQAATSAPFQHLEHFSHHAHAEDPIVEEASAQEQEPHHEL